MSESSSSSSSSSSSPVPFPLSSVAFCVILAWTSSFPQVIVMSAVRSELFSFGSSAMCMEQVPPSSPLSGDTESHSGMRSSPGWDIAACQASWVMKSMVVSPSVLSAETVCMSCEVSGTLICRSSSDCSCSHPVSSRSADTLVRYNLFIRFNQLLYGNRSGSRKSCSRREISVSDDKSQYYK